MVDVSLPLEEVVSREIIRKLRLVGCAARGAAARARDGTSPCRAPAWRAVTVRSSGAAQCAHDLAAAPQATEAENKEDREIVCEEVFCDVTGKLDAAAKGARVRGAASGSVGGAAAVHLRWRRVHVRGT